MIKVLGIENSIDWDRIVRSFSNYDIYWQSGYVKAFQIHGDGEPQLIYYEDSVSSIRAINVVMKRDIAEDKQEYYNPVYITIIQHPMVTEDGLSKIPKMSVSKEFLMNMNIIA